MLHYSIWSCKIFSSFGKTLKAYTSVSLIIQNIIPKALLEKISSITLLDLQYLKKKIRLKPSS